MVAGMIADKAIKTSRIRLIRLPRNELKLKAPKPTHDQITLRFRRFRCDSRGPRIARFSRSGAGLRCDLSSKLYVRPGLVRAHAANHNVGAIIVLAANRTAGHPAQ